MKYNEIIDKHFKGDIRFVLSVIANIDDDKYKVKNVRGSYWKESFRTLGDELCRTLTDVVENFDAWKMQPNIFKNGVYISEKDEYPQVAFFIKKHIKQNILNTTFSDVTKEVASWFPIWERGLTKPNDKSYGENFLIFIFKGSKNTMWDGHIPCTIFLKENFINTWWPGNAYGHTVSYWSSDSKEDHVDIRDFSRIGKR